jgi:hypothetical protein
MTQVPLLYLHAFRISADIVDQPTTNDPLPHPVAGVRLTTSDTKNTRVQRETTDDS